MKRLFVVVCVAVVAGGCAKRAGSIKAAALPSDTYSVLACDRIRADLKAEKVELFKLSQKQNDAAMGDAVGVFMLGLPLASILGSDNEGAIAVSKGKIDALESAADKNGCS